MAKVFTERLKTIEEQNSDVDSIETISIDFAKAEKCLAVNKKR